MIKLLKALTVAGLATGALLTVAIALAPVLPMLDILSNGLPLMVLGCVGVVALALLTGLRSAATAAAILLAINILLLFPALQSTAQTADPNQPRLLRIATYNVWNDSRTPEDGVAYLEDQDPDVIVLQEMWQLDRAPFSDLAKRYPHRLGDSALVILSKFPIESQGQITRAGFAPWNSTLARWMRITVNGVPVDIVGVHPARPFYPELQQNDMRALTGFVKTRQGPLVVAGDFNQSPWTYSLKSFTDVTGLGRLNTYTPTWPMLHRDVTLMPVLPIDNIFISSQLASLDLKAAPHLGSDHRALIADLALSGPAN